MSCDTARKDNLLAGGLEIIDRLQTTAWRATSLQYAKVALSPKGARLSAGRFNRDGFSALYLALDPTTAIAEYRQSGAPRPVMLVPVNVTLRHVVDLTGAKRGWPAIWKNWHCDWRAIISTSPTAECDSWKCGDDAIARNYSAILFPSLQNTGGKCLALFPEDATAGTCLHEVIDPLDELAKVFLPRSGK